SGGGDSASRGHSPRDYCSSSPTVETHELNMRDSDESNPPSVITRRALLKAGVVAAGAAMIPGSALASEWIRLPPQSHSKRAHIVFPRQRSSAPTRVLSFYNAHTGEALKTVYWENGEYIPGALSEVNYFFRDFRANEVKAIDPRL